jgi:hypothetical protein
MIVLHAALRGEALQVWGKRPRREDPALRPPAGVAAPAAFSADAGADAPHLRTESRRARHAAGAGVRHPVVADGERRARPLQPAHRRAASRRRTGPPALDGDCLHLPPRRGRPFPGRVHRPRVAGRGRVRRQGPGLRGGGAPVRGRPRRPPSARAERGGARGRPSRRLAAGDRGRGRRAVHLPCPRDARGRPGRRHGRGGASGPLLRRPARVLRRGPRRPPRPRRQRSRDRARERPHVRQPPRSVDPRPPLAGRDHARRARGAGALRAPGPGVAPSGHPRRHRALPADVPPRRADRRQRDGDRQRRQRVLDRPLSSPGRSRPQTARERGGRLERRGAPRCGARADAKTHLLGPLGQAARPAHRRELHEHAPGEASSTDGRLRFPEPQLGRPSRRASASSC